MNLCYNNTCNSFHSFKWLVDKNTTRRKKMVPVIQRKMSKLDHWVLNVCNSSLSTYHSSLSLSLSSSSWSSLLPAQSSSSWSQSSWSQSWSQSELKSTPKISTPIHTGTRLDESCDTLELKDLQDLFDNLQWDGNNVGWTLWDKMLRKGFLTSITRFCSECEKYFIYLSFFRL